MFYIIMSYILAPKKEMLTPLLTFAYARADLAYAHMYHILPYADCWPMLTRVLLTPHPYIFLYTRGPFLNMNTWVLNVAHMARHMA